MNLRKRKTCEKGNTSKTSTEENTELNMTCSESTNKIRDKKSVKSFKTVSKKSTSGHPRSLPTVELLLEESEVSQRKLTKEVKAPAPKKRGRPAKQQVQQVQLAATQQATVVEPVAKKSKPFTTSLVNSSHAAKYKIVPAGPRTETTRKEQNMAITEKKLKLPVLPPLPDEQDLFTPPKARRSLEEETASLVAWLDTVDVDTTLALHTVVDVLQLEAKHVFLICNVLEGLRMMVKVGSSSYTWLGRTSLDQTLVMLHQMAEEEKVGEMLLTRSCQLQPLNVEQLQKALVQKEGERSLQTRIEQEQDQEMEIQVQQQGEKMTTGVLTQRLVMAFLVAPLPSTLTVRLVSKVVQGQMETSSAFRTRVTSICQILTGLELIRKVSLESEEERLKTVAFQWIGPRVVRQ